MYIGLNILLLRSFHFYVYFSDKPVEDGSSENKDDEDDEEEGGNSSNLDDDNDDVSTGSGKTKNTAKSSKKSKDTGSKISRDAGSKKSKDTGSKKSKDTGSKKSKDTGSKKSKDTGSKKSKDTGSKKSKDAGTSKSKDKSKSSSRVSWNVESTEYEKNVEEICRELEDAWTCVEASLEMLTMKKKVVVTKMINGIRGAVLDKCKRTCFLYLQILSKYQFN